MKKIDKEINARIAIFDLNIVDALSHEKDDNIDYKYLFKHLIGHLKQMEKDFNIIKELVEKRE
jgi:hypothetical protein